MGETCVPSSDIDGGLTDGGRSDGPLPDGAVLSDGAAPSDGGGTHVDGGRDLEDGDPCPTDDTGHNLLSPSCQGDRLLYCNGSRVRVTDCTELGDRCLPGATADDLPRCDGGVYVSCNPATTYNSCADDAHALRCAGGYPNAPGYTYTAACESFGPGYTCLMNTVEGGCYPPGTVACDPAHPSSHCSADGASIVTCSDGLEYTVPCNTRLPGSVCDLGVGDEPVCVPRGAARCEPATTHGRCLSDTVTERCDYTTAHIGVFSCEPLTQCRVSDLGFADCVPDEAMSCDLATHAPRCVDHGRLAQCNRLGFESILDCTAAGPGYRCVPDMPAARCGIADDCDFATYAAHCDGDLALNCRPGGWVEEHTCSPFVPCRVTSGVAGCGS